MVDNTGIISRFIQLRKQYGPSQAEFGKKLGVSYAAISLIEMGKTTINEMHIKLITGTLKVNEEWLRFGKGPMLKDSTSPDDDSLLEIIHEISPEGRKLVKEHANMILKTERTINKVLVDQSGNS